MSLNTSLLSSFLARFPGAINQFHYRRPIWRVEANNTLERISQFGDEFVLCLERLDKGPGTTVIVNRFQGCLQPLDLCLCHSLVSGKCPQILKVPAANAFG
jgi:hypothetical protein